MSTAFSPGDAVEYDSVQEQAHTDGCITYPSGKRAVIRGTYVRRINAEYSDVKVGDYKPLLVRTSRLRHAPATILKRTPEVA